MDVVNVILTLTPAHYRWTFGDEGRADQARIESGPADFSSGDGLGVPYSPDLHCCASLVQHNYRQSSFGVFDQGGFPVHLERRGPQPQGCVPPGMVLWCWTRHVPCRTG